MAKKVFRSVQEIEKTYFPKWYKRKQKEKERPPGAFGEKLANELIIRLKRELRKINKESRSD